MSEKKTSYTGYTKAQGEATARYKKKHLKRIPLEVQKEKYDEIKDAATAAGEPVNTYIKKAIDQRMASEKEPESQ